MMFGGIKVRFLLPTICRSRSSCSESSRYRIGL